MGASLSTCVQVLNATKDTGELTTNERREILGYPPVDGGDVRQVSLNYVSADSQKEYQLGKNKDKNKEDDSYGKGKSDCPRSGKWNTGDKVLARTRHKPLVVDVREDGVYIRARLDGTEEGRKLYDEIKGGYIDRMSFQFTIRDQSYDKENHMWTVRKVKRLYDVSAVDIPAYDDTSIEARKNSILEADAQEQSERKAAAELSKRKLQLKMKLSM